MGRTKPNRKQNGMRHYDFKKLIEDYNWQTRSKEGWHNVVNKRTKCNCEATTPKGAYRDRVFKRASENVWLYFLHQNLIATINNGILRISSAGYKTRTTKNRLNKILKGTDYEVRQRSGEWYLINRESGDKKEFKDGMIVSRDLDRTYVGFY